MRPSQRPAPRPLAACAALLGLLAASPARADEFVTIDFPIHEQRIVATGLSAAPRQVSTPDGVGYAEVLLRPVRRETRVLLTFIFEENAGPGPAVFWIGDVSGRQVTIAENLGQGVQGWNRRTIALPAEITAEAGRLYVTGRQDRLRRLRIDWCEPTATLVAADQERPAFLGGGAILLDRDTTGQAAMTPPDAWFGPVLDAALQVGVADLSEDIELIVPVTGAPGRTRLRARFLGLPLGKSVRVWVNGRLAGRLHPVTPGLTDPGYIRRGQRTAYAGWREGALLLEPGALVPGENAIIFRSPGKGVYLSGAALEVETATGSGPPPAEQSAPEPPAAAAPANLPSAPNPSPSPSASSTPENHLPASFP